MSDINLAAIGQVITTSILIGGLLWGAVRHLLKRNESRHQQTEEFLTTKITDTKTELTNRIAETKVELRTAIGHVQSDVDELEDQVKAHTRDIGFLKERTAGLEGVVFKRPPLLDEDLSGGG